MSHPTFQTFFLRQTLEEYSSRKMHVHTLIEFHYSEMLILKICTDLKLIRNIIRLLNAYANASIEGLPSRGHVRDETSQTHTIAGLGS